MIPIEQAIFTSAKTDRSAGYQLVAKSAAVCKEDARELSIWGPSHDSLLELGSEAESFNFHRLPSGNYCVSRTSAAGFEYSGRGGHRVYTQSLLIPPEVLKRFANNPFPLIRAAQASGKLQVRERIPRQLEPIELAGRAAAVDQALLASLAANPGALPLATLVQTALHVPRLALFGPPSAAKLIAGVINCLPVECRTEFSFSTGLKYSSRRPFRLMALSEDRAEQRWVAGQNQVTVLVLSAETTPESIPLEGWAQLIRRVLASGRTSFLANRLSKRRPGLAPADLPALGLQLLEDLDATPMHSAPRPSQQTATRDASAKSTGADTPPNQVAASRNQLLSDEGPDESGLCVSNVAPRADAAHHRFEASSAAKTRAQLQATAPSKKLNPNSPEILEKLELLDDLVYEAINGQNTALEELQLLWPEILNELGNELVDESRVQYLRYALSIWEGCVGPHGVRSPARALQALDVLCLLFAED